MRIEVPENIGNDLLKLEGTCMAKLEGFTLGKSRNNQPKVTCKYIISDPGSLSCPDGATDFIGETVLETFSLQPKALFNINGLYKAVHKVNIPTGNYDEADFVEMLEKELAGTDWNLILELQPPHDDPSGELRTVITKRSYAG